MDRVKRRNDLECIDILKEFHDDELRQDEPSEELMEAIKRLIALVEKRHKHEDAKEPA